MRFGSLVALGCVAAASVAVTSVTASCQRTNPFDLAARRRTLAMLARSPLDTDPNVGTYTQRRDHFGSSVATWEQRFKLVTEHWKPGGPMFLFLSGEAPMEFFEFQEVQIYTWAKAFNAAYAVIEHRGYGKSWPTDDATVSSMRYISSRQALADAAAFLPWIRTKAGVSPDARAVVFGCSYSGALSSWFRLLYPDLVVASIAPSGPVEAKLDYAGFFRQFPTSAGPECAANVAQTTAAVEALLAQGNTAELCTAFNCCPGETLEDPMDQMLFRFSLTGTIGSADQMSNPPTFSLNGTCDILADQSQGPINALVKAFNYVNAHPDDVSVTAGCNSFSYNDTIASMTGTTTAGNADGGRSWYWQKCTEFGYFKGYEDASAIFPSVPYTFPLGMCAAVFGIPGMTPNIDATNAFYGGKALNATNVFFTNGLLDPWHLLSITLSNGNGVLAANYEAGHCATLIATADNDPPSLTAARTQVEQFLATVLAP